MSRKEPIIGIDLGTTHSVVAAVVDGHAKVIPSRTGQALTPSVVAISPSGTRLVGQVARRQAITNPAQTVFASKRFLGRCFSHPQVQEDLKNIPFEVVSGPQDDVRARMGGQNLSMQEIAAMLLVELKLDAEAFFGRNVTRAVITVPAYFTHAQRQATKEAAQIAGLEVLRLVNEPTAAALAYGFGKTVQGKIAVFDLGGGTFDVSVLDVHNEVFEVVGTGGDSHLGGEDFDKAIVDYLLEEFRSKHNVDLRRDRVALQRVKDAAEAAKIELSTVTQTKIQLPFIYRPAGAGNPLHLEANLTRQKLEELTEEICLKTVRLTEQALQDAKAKNVKEIILVGGMTRMPRIVQVVKSHFNKEPCKGVHPDEVVALGAAILGHSLTETTNESKALLLDVTPQSLGVVVAGGFVHQLIPRGTTVPVATSQVFNTSKDNQNAVTITVTQGESRVAHENAPLGEFQLTGIRKGLRGEVKIEVTFDIDAGGLVSVTAKDLKSGQSHQILVTTQSGLSPEEFSSSIRHQMDYVRARRAEREKHAPAVPHAS